MLLLYYGSALLPLADLIATRFRGPRRRPMLLVLAAQFLAACTIVAFVHWSREAGYREWYWGWAYNIPVNVLCGFGYLTILMRPPAPSRQQRKAEEAAQRNRMNLVLEDLNSLAGIQVIEKGKGQIQLTEQVTLEQVQHLLDVFRKHGREFAIYDPCFPSPSDPGAYFSYSPEKALLNTWNMTLGNHGWTGGIYVIDEKTVALQLKNLAARKLLEQVDLGGACFFSRYSPVEKARNERMNEQLLILHLNMEEYASFSDD